MDILIILFLILILVLLGASLYANWNLLQKVEQYEESIELYETFISEKAGDYKKLLEKMRQIDQNQIFEKDDDVGSIFNGIKTLIEHYDRVF
jgi:type II secretory pathway component PulL